MSSRKRNPDRRRPRQPTGAKRRREPERKRPAAASDAHKLAGALAAKTKAKLLMPARALLATAVRLWLAVAERAGALVLTAWRRALRPLAAALARLAVATYRALARHLTPARAVALVCLVALAALFASQWLDYRTVAIGTDAYSGVVETVTGAPEVDRARAGDAHAWVMLPLALTGLVALVLAFAGRPRAARLLVAVGAAVLAISLLVDLPNGLDVGAAGVAYEGAAATLIEGFWLQIAAAAVLIAAGAMLPRYLRPAAVGAAREPRARRRRRRPSRPRLPPKGGTDNANRRGKSRPTGWRRPGRAEGAKG
jgi:hypothetical protein